MVKRPRGRPPRNPYQALRVKHLYDCLRKRFDSDYRFAVELHRAFVSMDQPKTLETCKVVVRNLRRQNQATLSEEYLEALARAADPGLPAGALRDDEPLLRFMRTKLRAVRDDGETRYLGWRYYEYLLTRPNEEFPWITAYLYVDDTDVAIDVAEVLGFPPDEVAEVEEKVVQRLEKKVSVHEWNVLAALAGLHEGEQEPPRMLYAATSLLLSYLGFVQRFIYVIWGRPGEKLIPDRSAPPVGQRAKRFEEYFKEFVEFAKLHGSESKLTDEQKRRVAVLLLRLQTFWQKTC
jgi:hypothetical protein